MEVTQYLTTCDLLLENQSNRRFS